MVSNFFYQEIVLQSFMRFYRNDNNIRILKCLRSASYIHITQDVEHNLSFCVWVLQSVLSIPRIRRKARPKPNNRVVWKAKLPCTCLPGIGVPMLFETTLFWQNGISFIATPNIKPLSLNYLCRRRLVSLLCIFFTSCEVPTFLYISVAILCWSHTKISCAYLRLSRILYYY